MFDVQQIKSKKYILLETYRKNGQSVKTPVWFVVKEGLVYVVTRSQTGKVRRLHNSLQVRIALCTVRGSIKGDWVSGTAKILSGEEINAAVKWRDEKYGFIAKIAKFVSKNKGEFFAFSIKITDG